MNAIASAETLGGKRGLFAEHFAAIKLPRILFLILEITVTVIPDREGGDSIILALFDRDR